MYRAAFAFCRVRCDFKFKDIPLTRKGLPLVFASYVGSVLTNSRSRTQHVFIVSLNHRANAGAGAGHVLCTSRSTQWDGGWFLAGSGEWQAYGHSFYLPSSRTMRCSYTQHNSSSRFLGNSLRRVPSRSIPSQLAVASDVGSVGTVATAPLLLTSHALGRDCQLRESVRFGNTCSHCLKPRTQTHI